MNEVTRIPSSRIVIRKAERKKSKLRLALVGPTGAGKTYSALQLAFGLGIKIGLIDTEHGSGDLYADLGDYDVITLEPPYTVAKYRDAIRAFEDAGYDTIIVDSLSHAWSGEGGLLDKQGQLENSGKYRNSFATWREITPEHNKLVEQMLGSPAHVIATMRTKTEYVVKKDDRGKCASSASPRCNAMESITSSPSCWTSPRTIRHAPQRTARRCSTAGATASLRPPGERCASGSTTAQSRCVRPPPAWRRRL
jgi:hypothetical protein